jgi:Invasion associated locus B (IalB) protein
MIARIAGALAGLTLSLAASAAMAQQTGTETECVSAKTDWSVCVWTEPKECWGVSKPKESVNSRDGKPVSVRRGDILLFVTFRPSTGAAGEVSFTGGYPFAPGSTVGVDIQGKTFDLVADGEWAWPSSKEDDAAILAALKAGSSAVVSARSGRGTQTQDTFSLNGFTAAMTEAEARCK